MNGLSSPERLSALALDDDGLFERLHCTGMIFNEVVGQLHGLMLRAARHQLSRMSNVRSRLGTVGLDEIANQAADDATIAAPAKLDSFEGRSKFTTWVYKFGILHALSGASRALWKDREVPLDVIAERPSKDSSPEALIGAAELSSLLSTAIATSLTPRQRAVVTALILNDVPIDALAERLDTTRNVIYKNLYDARKRLRSSLSAQGYPTEGATRGVRA
jgi:RNA polymerase sigma-70 factor (ECF subfamily)